MASKEYRLIQEETGPDEIFTHYHDNIPSLSKKRRLVTYILCITLALSLAANALLTLHSLRRPYDIPPNKTAFAGLERNTPIAWTDDSAFASHNRSTWDQAWASLNPDTGYVAISDAFALRTGLHESQRWPWDASKGLYLLQGYHSLHCLTILRASLVEMHDQKPQSLHFRHINHCLDGLRQEIVCNADDTPRYSGLDQEEGTGRGQVRMCRDWGKLEEWAERHSACYEYEPGVESLEGGIPLDRFKHCPDGSEPWMGGVGGG